MACSTASRLKFFVDKFSHVRFEPSGYTGNPQIPFAKSIMDYMFRWLALKFVGPEAVPASPNPIRKCSSAPKRSRSASCRSPRRWTMLPSVPSAAG